MLPENVGDWGVSQRVTHQSILMPGSGGVVQQQNHRQTSQGGWKGNSKAKDVLAPAAQDSSSDLQRGDGSDTGSSGCAAIPAEAPRVLKLYIELQKYMYFYILSSSAHRGEQPLSPASLAKGGRGGFRIAFFKTIIPRNNQGFAENSKKTKQTHPDSQRQTWGAQHNPLHPSPKRPVVTWHLEHPPQLWAMPGEALLLFLAKWPFHDKFWGGYQGPWGLAARWSVPGAPRDRQGDILGPGR